MLGPLGEDFAKVKASITTALDKITQVLKMAVKMVHTRSETENIFNILILDPKHKRTKSPGLPVSHMFLGDQ